MARALHYIRQADVLLIGGTSLVVYPAAGLITYYRGHKLAVVNKGGGQAPRRPPLRWMDPSDRCWSNCNIGSCGAQGGDFSVCPLTNRGIFVIIARCSACERAGIGRQASLRCLCP